MGRRAKTAAAIVAAVVLAGALVLWRPAARRTDEAPAVETPLAAAPPVASGSAAGPVVPREPEPAQPVARPAPAATVVRSAAPRVDDARDEASLMTELHELGETRPALSLQLASEGNDRFPSSAAAPERAWIVVKSLVNLGRFDEAKAEAETMVAKYPDTSWASDVQRHLLSNPLYPTEDP